MCYCIEFTSTHKHTLLSVFVFNLDWQTFEKLVGFFFCFCYFLLCFCFLSVRFSRRPLPGTQSADSGTCTSMMFILLIRNQISVDSQAAERRGIFESQLWRETPSQEMQGGLFHFHLAVVAVWSLAAVGCPLRWSLCRSLWACEWPGNDTTFVFECWTPAAAWLLLSIPQKCRR